MTAKAQETQDKQTTDRIEKQIDLRAARSRVWRALTSAEEFGTWFRVNLDGAFAEGATVRGRITHPGYEHLTVEILVERIEAERYFSYRWHPYPIDPAVDYSAEPTTLVEFTLQETEGGTALTIVESGFDRIPLGRRSEAFRMNDQGWTGQIKNLAQYVS
ncbi:MAG: SRPBCC family protein [Gemmatimonadales bacterium]